MAARAETSRLASFATSAEIVSWFSMTWPQPTLRPQHGVESGQAGGKRRAGNGVATTLHLLPATCYLTARLDCGSDANPQPVQVGLDLAAVGCIMTAAMDNHELAHVIHKLPRLSPCPRPTRTRK